VFGNLKADFKRYYDLLPDHYGPWEHFLFFLKCQGQWALVDYRWRKWLRARPLILRFLLGLPTFFGHIFVESFTGISLPTRCTIGKGLYIGHFSGIFVNDAVVMGEGVSLSQGVTVGIGGRGERYGVPTVGNRVYFGPGSKTFGKITIGENAKIGANAVVNRSVPAGATAVGIPARILVREKPNGG